MNEPKKIDWKQVFIDNYCSLDISKRLMEIGFDPLEFSVCYDEDGKLCDGAHQQEYTGGTERYYPALNLTDAMTLFYGRPI